MIPENDKMAYDCDDILSRGQIIHLGLLHPHKKQVPYVVPLNYGYDAQVPCLYMHTHTLDETRTTSLKLEALQNSIKQNTDICFEVETDVQVLPLVGGSPCFSTTRYSSVIGFGKVELIVDDAEKKEAALKVILRQNTGLPASCWKGLDPKYIAELIVVKLLINPEKITAKKHGYG